MQKHTSRMIALVILLSLLAGCSQSPAAAPAAVEPTTAPTAAPTAAVEPTTAPTEAPAVAAPAQVSVTPSVIDGGRISFLPGKSDWYTNGMLEPMTAQRFVAGAQAGQQMNIWLSTDPPTGDSSLAYLYVTDPKGQSMLISPEMYFSQVLAETGDYTIDVVGYTNQPVGYTLVLEIPAVVINPALGMQYDLPDVSVCQAIADSAGNALGVSFVLQPRAPFLDQIAGEAGQGCRMMILGNGTQFAGPQSVMSTLVGSAGLGWNDQPAYRADGPTGSSAGLTRDMALMLISVNWEPAMGVVCPPDQPISNCNLTPEQKAYRIQIDLAQYRAAFSLDGHWEDAATGFMLDLGQDWKNVYGMHTIVAQGGNKIDSLDASITGMISGNGADIQFQSSFAAGLGAARITVVDANTITWQIVTPPQGEYYLPAAATLVRK